MNREEHERIVADGLKKMGVKEIYQNDIDTLMANAKSKIRVVRDFAQIIDNEVKSAGKDHNRKMLIEEVSKRYLDGFCDHNKEELLILFSLFLTEATIKEIV